MKIMLDAGHGAGFASNRGFLYGENEGDFNWKCVEYFRLYAKKTYGVEVGTTRPKRTDNPDLKPRGNMARGHDLFISWHSNAFNGQARGVELYDDVNPKFSNKILATKITQSVASTLGIQNRGVKYKKYQGGNYYGVLRNGLAKSNMLLEVCFHDNKYDAKLYINLYKKVVENVCDTIMDHYGVRKVNSTPKGVKTNHLVQVKDPALNIRQKPDGKSKIVGVIRDKGIYTIVEQVGNWGKLKSGMGWIWLKGFTERLNQKAKVTTVKKTIKVGSKVRIKSTASRYYTGETIPSRFKGKTYTVLQVGSGRSLIKELYSWVKNSDLEVL